MILLGSTETDWRERSPAELEFFLYRSPSGPSRFGLEGLFRFDSSDWKRKCCAVNRHREHARDGNMP